MNISQDVSLKEHSTMRLGGSAKYLTEATTRQELQEAVKWALSQQLPVMTIGSGSNLIWPDAGFPGLVIVNKIMGFETFNEDEENLYVTVGSGEDWDEVVKRCVDLGYSGLEQLSLIPGTAGATPVQNVGAYGREIADCLVCVEVYDSQTDTFMTIPTSDCAFGYRTSRFKTTDKGRFYISHVTFHLIKANPQPPFYASVQQYFDDRQITADQVTPQILREAVIAVRTSKLPDPDIVANNGSFFANPIVDTVMFTELRDQFPNIVSWQMPDGNIKLSAAWLIENVGFKGFHDHETGMATWDKQALVIVNEHASSTADLLKFKQKIVDAVQQKFGIALEQEPELVMPN